jgi:hypothetical protein
MMQSNKQQFIYTVYGIKIPINVGEKEKEKEKKHNENEILKKSNNIQIQYAKKSFFNSA